MSPKRGRRRVAEWLPNVDTLPPLGAVVDALPPRATIAKVDHTKPTEVKAALDVFGGLMIGIEFPRAAMDQFNAGRPWDVIRDDGGIEGGQSTPPRPGSRCKTPSANLRAVGRAGYDITAGQSALPPKQASPRVAPGASPLHSWLGLKGVLIRMAGNCSEVNRDLR